MPSAGTDPAVRVSIRLYTINMTGRAVTPDYPGRRISPLLNPYRYMRLFCMNPGQPGDEIRGSFEIASIETQTSFTGTNRYIALSHCWGQSTESVRIWVDGFPTMIRQTLHEALLHLRSADKDIALGSTGIWVDEICIAQYDSDERSCQIRRMDHIFEFSVKVIAWLGPATALSDLLFRALRTAKGLGGNLDVESLADADTLATDGNDARWVRICNYREIALPGGPREYNRLFLALTDLLERPYFSRLWTVQECVLAPRLVFQAGNEQLDSAALATILRDMKSLNHSYLRNVHADNNIIRSSAVLELRHICSAYQTQDKGWLTIDPGGCPRYSPTSFCAR